MGCLPYAYAGTLRREMEQYRVVELKQPDEFKFKYPFVVYRYVRNKGRKPIYSACRQFKNINKAYDYIEMKCGVKV